MDIFWLVVAIIVGYTFVGGVFMHVKYYLDMERCPYGQNNHTYRTPGGSTRYCEHELTSGLTGLFWFIGGPFMIGREVARGAVFSQELRQERKLARLKREKEIANQRLEIAKIDEQRKLSEARTTDEMLRQAGLGGVMGPNPYDRDNRNNV